MSGSVSVAKGWHAEHFLCCTFGFFINVFLFFLQVPHKFCCAPRAPAVRNLEWGTCAPAVWRRRLCLPNANSWSTTVQSYEPRHGLSQRSRVDSKIISGIYVTLNSAELTGIVGKSHNVTLNLLDGWITRSWQIPQCYLELDCWINRSIVEKSHNHTQRMRKHIFDIFNYNFTCIWNEIDANE